MDVFDIIGPIMIGPSSSHTAGACRIGYYARKILGEEPMEATIQFSGSFKDTYKGHGTDRAVVAGLMGFAVDDVRLKDSMDIAQKEGRKFSIVTEDIDLAHPNTALITMKRKNGATVSVQGASLGGGNIKITKLNGVDVSIDGRYDVLLVGHRDVPGMIHKITKVLWQNQININGLSLHRTEKAGNAVVIIEVDEHVRDDVRDVLLTTDDVISVTLLHALQ